MTNEEAIKEASSGYTKEDAIAFVEDEIYKALVLAYEPSDKRSSVKPSTSGNGIYECYICGRVLDPTVHSENGYCPKCGQKIDWSE